MSRVSRNAAGAALPAPLLVVATLVVATIVLGIGLDRIARVGAVGLIPTPLRLTLSVSVMLVGGWLLDCALRSVPPVGAQLRPYVPTQVLAFENVYTRSRNPLYLGFGILVVGLAVFMGSDGTIMALVPSALVVHYGIVLREERYLEREFGDEYRRYKATVPRYGWRR